MTPAKRLSEHGLAIFLFHGVVEECSYAVRNYNRKHLPVAEFREAITQLTQGGKALSLDDVLHHIEQRTPFPPNAFAVTFDDGFENNFSIAAPILKELRVPATFYVTTDFIQNNHMSWIDRIELCLERHPTGSLQLPWMPAPCDYASAATAIALLDNIRAQVKTNPRIDPDHIVEQVFEQCGEPRVDTSNDALDRKMNWSQVTRLASDKLFTVGGHTHRHAILAFMEDSDLENELDTSLGLLRNCAGIATHHYSYPEGLAHCYSAKVIDGLKQRGIRCCPTAIDGVNTCDTDPFELRRIAVA